jgi:hypothetical protein
MVRMTFYSLTRALLTFETVDTETYSLWTTIEIGLGIVAGSLATLRPLFRSIVGSTVPSEYRPGESSGRVERNGKDQSDDKKEMMSIAATNPSSTSCKNYTKQSVIYESHRLEKASNEAKARDRTFTTCLDDKT